MKPSSVTGIYINPGLGESYFDRLVARPDHWKSWSMRDKDLVAGKKYITYDPVNDTHPQKQNATKITIPAFAPTTSLSVPISATDISIIPVDKRKALWPKGRVIRLDNEIMTVAGMVIVNDQVQAVNVNRAQYNTVATAHINSVIEHSTNTVPSKLSLPLYTSDDHSYFFVFDSFWCDEYVKAGAFNHKAFHFLSGGSDVAGTLFWELQATYGKVTSPYIASHQVRGYNNLGGDPDYSKTDGNRLGPLVTSREPIKPYNTFHIQNGIWTRFMLYVVQRKDNYDSFTAWVADELTAPVKVLDNIQASIRRGAKVPMGIATFAWEMNSSNDALLRTDLRNLYSYVRGFVALIDPVNLPIEQPRREA